MTTDSSMTGPNPVGPNPVGPNPVGPGHIAQAHEPDEYVTLVQLAQCESFMRGLAATKTLD